VPARRHLAIGCPGQWLAILLVLSTTAPAWLLSGVSPGEASRFVVYELLYVLLPGCLLYVLLSPRPGGWLRTVAIGWPCGYAIAVGGYALTAALHVRGVFVLQPLVAVVAMGPFLYRRLRRHLAMSRGRLDGAGGPVPDRARNRGFDALLVAAAISAATLLLTFTFYSPYPLPARAHSIVYSGDSLFDISLAAEARHHWPITEPWVADQPFHYYTGVFIHVAAINQVTGVAPTTVFLRLLPSVMFLLTALQLWSLGRSLNRSRWIGPVAVILLLALEDLNLDPTHTEVFHVSPFTQFSLSPTFAFGVSFFLGLLVLVQARFIGAMRVNPAAERNPHRPPWGETTRSLALATALILGCGAAKTFAAADFIGGLGLFWLWCVLTARPARPLFYCMVLSAVCIGIVYSVMLAGGMASTMGVHPFDFIANGSTLERVKNAVKSVTGYSGLWILAPLAGAPAMAIVLFAPLLGALWLLRDRSNISPSVVLLLCMFLVGMLAYVTLGAPGGVEGVFLVYGYIALVPVAAMGLVALWNDTPKSARPRIARACGAVLIVGLVMAGFTEVLTLAGRSRYAWYVLAYGLVAGAVVVFTFKYARLFAPTVSSRFGRAAACCIPLLCTLGLVKPVTLTATGAWKTVRHERISVADSADHYGMTAALYRGLLWVRGHTTSCDVLAVNNHLTSSRSTVSLYFYYSAFTERRVFLESWYYTPYGTLSPQPFPARFKLNTEALTRGDPAALRKLREAGVSYVLIDKTHGGGAPEPPGVSRLVFSNSALDVYRLLTPEKAIHTVPSCGTAT
jgi:hypothetical protein